MPLNHSDDIKIGDAFLMHGNTIHIVKGFQGSSVFLTDISNNNNYRYITRNWVLEYPRIELHRIDKLIYNVD